MGKFNLMTLPYEADALEPVISRETIGFHHGKHLAAYVNNLNALLPGSGFEEATLEEIVCKASGGILNNAGQILNHELYFAQFTSPKEGNNTLWQRLGLALGRQRRQTRHYARAECRQSDSERTEASFDLRRLGARLLSRLSEPQT